MIRSTTVTWGHAGIVVAVVALSTLSAQQCRASGGSTAGGEFLVNQTTRGTQNQAASAMNAAGDFVIVWSNGTGLNISARAYLASGLARSGELIVNATTAGTQNEPTVAIDDAGDFLVAWTDYNGRDGDALGVIAQRYLASGVRVGPEFAIPSMVAGSQFQASAAMDPAGNFAVAWVDSTAGGNPDIHARLFAGDGTAIGPQFLVNVRTQSNQVSPAVGVAEDGRCIVAWMDRGSADGSGHGVFFRIFAPNGAALTGDVSVPVVTAGDQKDPFVAVARDGRFVVSWTDFSGLDGSGPGVYFRLFDRDGAPLTGQFRANDVTSGSQFSSPVGLDAEGRITVAWVETSGRDGSGAGIFGRCFQPNGTAMGPSRRLNATTFGDQAGPWLSVADGGSAVVVFEDRSGADGEAEGIFAQRYAAPPPPVSDVPAMGTTSLVVLGGALLVAATLLLRRRAG